MSFLLPLVHIWSFGSAISYVLVITIGSHMLFWFGNQLCPFYYHWSTHGLLVGQSAMSFLLPLFHTCSFGLAISWVLFITIGLLLWVYSYFVYYASVRELLEGVGKLVSTVLSYVQLVLKVPCAVLQSLHHLWCRDARWPPQTHRL